MTYTELFLFLMVFCNLLNTAALFGIYKMVEDKHEDKKRI